MPKSGVQINIAITPEAAVLRQAIALSKQFRAEQERFILNKTSHIPHITIYRAKFPEKNIPAILDAIRKLTHKFPHLRLTADSYRQTKNNYMEVMYKKIKMLARLQKELIQSINHLRENMPYNQELHYTKTEKRNLERYGYESAFKNFEPHLSLTRFPIAAGKLDTRNLPSLKNFSFHTETLDVFLLSKHRTHEKIIGRVKFRGAR